MIAKIKTLMAISLLLLVSGSALAQDSGGSMTTTERRQKADAEMEKARELLKQGYFDSAVVKYQDAFKIAPKYTAPYEELGKLMMEKRNFAYAIQMYSKLGELEPNNAGYQKVLFNLYDAYDAPNEALNAGRQLQKLGEADNKTLKRMAELYGIVDRPIKKADTMVLYAEATDADAEYWNEIASIYLNQSKPDPAEDAVLVALEKAPGNKKYRNTLGRVYASQDKMDKAEEVFDKLVEDSPNDQGLKDELAQLYAQQGDSYLVKGRANTALEYYDKAKQTGNVGDEDSDAIVGQYKGTLNTTSQVFNTNANTTGAGLADYRRGGTGFSPLGGSISDRIETANRMLSPQYIFDGDFGNQAGSSYTLIDNVVRVPVRGTELDLRVRHSWRDVSDSLTGSASREYLYLGANYNWNRDWSTLAYVGSSGFYDVTTLYEGDVVRGGVRFQHDVWNYTPIALGTDLEYDRQGLFGGVSIGDRWSIDGELDFYQFDDGIDQTIYSIGPTYQLIFEPGVQELSLSYIYSGITNTRTISDNIRFSPRAFNANSIGFDYNRVITKNWRLRGGYFHTWTNDNSSGGTWNLGSDFQLWDGAWLGVDYQRGNFRQGVIAPNLQSTDDNNDNINVNFGVSF